MAAWIHGSPNTAILDGASYSYHDLRLSIDRWLEQFRRSTKPLVFHLIENRFEHVAALLGALEAECAVALLDPEISDDLLNQLVDRYKPEIIVGPVKRPSTARQLYSYADVAVYDSGSQANTAIHPDLALLLSTSGSTGSPKLVRLSKSNLQANSRQIATALGLGPTDRACGHLALHYSYGLSVLLSHLSVEASVAMVEGPFTSEVFWSAVRDANCTSFPGVPYHYEVLRRLDLDKLNVPALKTCTQAGGRLSPQLVRLFAEKMKLRGGSFYVMYGQTEASPRMTTTADDDVLSYPDTVGRAMSDGTIQIFDENASPLPVGADGEIVYSGPNVMLGYAQSRADLQNGDECNGVLRTGDIGRVDHEGRLFITGRVARIAKVLGLRINLDEIEKVASTENPLAAVDLDGKLAVAVEQASADQCAAIGKQLSDFLNLHPSMIKIRSLDALPLLGNGKIDRQSLKELLR